MNPLNYPQQAARFIMLSMTPGVNALQNNEYRELLQQYHSIPEFSEITLNISTGMGLSILMCDQRNLYIRPESKDSMFAYKPADIRTLKTEQRVAYFLCVVSLSATFFPDAQALDDSGQLRPMTRREIHEALNEHIQMWAGRKNTVASPQLQTGLSILEGLPVHLVQDLKKSQYRGGATSRSGILELVLNDLQDNGFVRVNENMSAPEQSQINPTHKFRQHLGSADGAIEKLMSLLKTKDSHE